MKKYLFLVFGLMASNNSFAALWGDEARSSFLLALNDDELFQGDILKIMAAALPKWRQACNAALQPERDYCNLQLNSIVSDLTDAQFKAGAGTVDMVRADEQIFVPIINQANQLQLGVPPQLVQPALALSAAQAYFKFHYFMEHVIEQYQQAMALVAHAISLAENDAILAQMVPERLQITYIYGQTQVMDAAFYQAIGKNTLANIAALALVQIGIGPQGPVGPPGNGLAWGGGGGGGNGGGGGPIGTQFFDPVYGFTNLQLQPPEAVLDFANQLTGSQYRFEERGAVWKSSRMIYMTYRVPADGLVLQSDITDYYGNVVIPSGTEICAASAKNNLDNLSYVQGGCLRVNTYNFDLKFQFDGEQEVGISSCSNKEELRPGESTTCGPLVYRTDGPPPGGEFHSVGFTIFEMDSKGPDAKHIRQHVKVKWNSEIPSDNCYYYNYSSFQWESTDAPGCPGGPQGF